MNATREAAAGLWATKAAGPPATGPPTGAPPTGAGAPSGFSVRPGVVPAPRGEPDDDAQAPSTAAEAAPRKARRLTRGFGGVPRNGCTAAFSRLTGGRW